MLYLVGGAARSGKSLLARQMPVGQETPYFCLDYLTSGLAVGAPDLGIFHDLASVERAEKLWPVVEGLLRNIAEVEPRYLVEGEAILPRNAADLRSRYPDCVRICFLGYARADVDAKCERMRSSPGEVNDWVADLSDSDLRNLVMEMKDFSEYLERECARWAIRYVDTAGDFSGSLRAAYSYLVSP